MPKVKKISRADAKRLGILRQNIKRHRSRKELKHRGTFSPVKPILGVSVQPETGKKRERFP